MLAVVALNTLLLAIPDNPLVQVRGASPTREPVGTSRYGRCLDLRLRVTYRDGALAGTVDAQNRCSTALAVLLEPVETIVRGADQLGRWIDPQESATARLFIDPVAQERRPHSDAGHLDTGYAVMGGPGYAVVSPGETIAIPVVGGARTIQRLPPGVYRATLTTYVAAVEKAARSTVSELQLDRDVAAHNAISKGDVQVEIRPGAELVGTAPDAFEVRTTDR